MVLSALFSTLHLFGFAIGLPGIFLRGAGLKKVQTDPSAIAQTLQADNAWGLAALLWVSTGLARAFGPFEKGAGFYLNSTSFLVKMALVIAVFALEVWPMVTFIKWRIARGKGHPIDVSRARQLKRVNDVELVLTLVAPFFASAMARGVGFGLPW